MIEALKNSPVGMIFILAGIGMIVYSLVKIIIYFTVTKPKQKGAEILAMFRKEYERLLPSLAFDAETIDVSGVPVEVRSTADREKGRLDPRTEETGKMTREEFKKNYSKLNPLLQPNEIHLFGPEDPENYTTLEYIRAQFGWVTPDLSSGITETRKTIEGSRGEIEIYIYKASSTDTERSCMVFFHGGGFFGGVIPTTENQCKLLAQLSGGVVISVDYPLAPEYRFPAGLDACYETVEWAYTNAKSLGISPQKIAVCGDSAGGNLALVSAIRARDEGKKYISYMALIYPTVTRAHDETSEYYYFDKEAYLNPDNDPYITEQITAIAKSGDRLIDWYLEKDTDPMDPYVSPIVASFKGLPQALVITAEYDYLRLECEALSRKLIAAGIKTRHIRYGGIVHGTFDRLGYAPQVEDMLREIAKDLRRLK